MDYYPHEVSNDPVPSVFLIGSVDNEPDFHSRLIKSFENTLYDNDFKEFPKLNYRSISADLAFPGKKPAKEVPSQDGILRSNWFLKHYQQLPSVVLFMATFSSDWTLADWIRREASYTERYNRMKISLGSRGCVIVFVLVKVGAVSSTQVDKELIEERVATLKRHIQGENKLFLMISLPEVLANSSMAKRLVRNLREFSHTYYSAQYRKAKLSERQAKSKGPFEQLFSARYGIKAAFFLEFLGQPSQALQYYRQASAALTEVMKSVSDNEMKHQCKILGSYTNYKICNILFKTGVEKEAFVQFKSHISFYSPLSLTDLGCAWRHEMWMCDQYLTYLHLLDTFGVPGPSIGSDRVYFLLNAARYATKRHSKFQEYSLSPEYANLMSTETTEYLHKGINIQSVVLSTSRFVGMSSSLYDPTLDKYYDESDLSTKQMRVFHLIRTYIDGERALDHSALILGYLWQAQDKVPSHQVRTRARVSALIADHYLRMQRYDEALSHYAMITELLSNEKWNLALLPVLKNKYYCEYVLGRSSHFVRTSLSYYSLSLQQNTLSESEEGSLQTSIFDVFRYQTDQHLFNDFGQFSGLNNNLKEEIPDLFTIEFSPSEPMFQLNVVFSKPSILLGESVSVRISVVSSFHRSIELFELDFEFHSTNCQSIVQQFRSKGEKNKATANKTETVTDLPSVKYQSLELKPNTPAVFEFEISVLDSHLDSVAATEWGLCLERVRMTLKVPLAGTMTTNSKATTDSDKITSIAASKSIIFKMVPHTTEFIKSREYFGNTHANLLDVKKYLDIKYVPGLLQLNRPLADITMLGTNTSSESVSGSTGVPIPGPLKLCQGSIQRVNVDFSVTKCPTLNGKVYLSVDYSPRDCESAFFWHPDLSKWMAAGADSSRVNLTEEDTDSVLFHPFKLNASMQPESPLLLPTQQPGSFFSVPLFVRSETEGLYKIKLVIEYYPREDILSVATKEFQFEVLFQKPVDIKFRLSVIDNIRKGVSRDFNNTMAPVTTVCRDDVVNMMYTIQCVHPMYSGAIKLLTLKVQSGDNSITTSTTANGNESDFSLLTDENQQTPSNESIDVLSSLSTTNASVSTSDSVSCQSCGVVLTAQEVYEMNHELLCCSSNTNSDSLTSGNNNTNGSGGYDSLVDSIARADKIKLQAVAHVTLGLRVINSQFLSSPDLSRYQSSTPSLSSSCSSSIQSSGTFGWLLQPTVAVESREAKLKRETSMGVATGASGNRSRSSSPVPQTQDRDMLLGTDPSVSLTRVAHLLFMAPSVQVIDSPFTVDFRPPTKCSFGDTVYLNIGIQSKLLEVAHLQVKVQSGSEFLITGSINQTIYVMSGEQTTVPFGLFPVRTGLLKFPSFVVTWLKTAAVVLDSGSESERFLYVYPNTIHA